jgi:RND family efflux transporter MFP subunit
MNGIKTPAILLSCMLILAGCSPEKRTRKYTIQQGDFQASITESGELQAVVARHIVMPFLGWRYGYQNKITGLAEHGKQVEEGDSVVALDPSGVMQYLVDRENRLEIEKATLEKAIVEHRIKAKQLLAELEQQEASYDMEKLELEKSQFDSEKNKQIQQLEFQKAEINLNKTRRSIEYNDKIAELDKRIQSTKVRQRENDTTDAHLALQRLVLRSPNDGILQIEYNRRTHQLYKTGDEVHPNRSLASIPDLRKMKVESTVNELDIDKVRLGQKVIVRLDAFPDLEFNGEVTYVGKLSRRKERGSSIKVFDLEVRVEENENEVLKPGMTVSCEIIYAELKDVFYVSNECITRENGNYYIHRVHRGEVLKQEVDIGPRNNTHTIIRGDLRKGQEVLPKSRLNEADI